MVRPLLLAAGLLLAAPALPFDGIRVTLLGGDAVVRQPQAPRAGTLVEADGEALLFDCGPDTLAGMERAGMSSDAITAIFLTQARPDSLSGCRQLWAGSAQSGRTDSWEVWGPEGTRAAIDALGDEAGGARIEVTEISENLVYQTDTVSVTAFVAERSSSEPAFGYRVDFRERSVVIAVDNRYSATLARISHRANVLVCRVALAAPGAAEGSKAVRDALALYASPEESAKLFRAAHPGLVLFAYAGLFGATEDDLVRRTRRIYPGPVEIGRERMVVEVENEVQVRAEPSERRSGAR
jgi:ribonuclease Z